MRTTIPILQTGPAWPGKEAARRFYHKITLAFLALLAAALCAVGLAMTAASFSAGLASARAAALAQHSRDRYGVEQAVYAQYETGAAYGAQPYGNDQLAAALQTYAAQAAPGAQLPEVAHHALYYGYLLGVLFPEYGNVGLDYVKEDCHHGGNSPKVFRARLAAQLL